MKESDEDLIDFGEDEPKELEVVEEPEHDLEKDSLPTVTKQITVRDIAELTVAVEKHFVPIVKAMVEEAEELSTKITSDAAVAKATDMAVSANRKIKTLDEMRQNILGDAGKYVNKVNALFRLLKPELEKIPKKLRAPVGNYQAMKKLEAAKQEKQAREAVEELNKKLKSEAEAVGMVAPEITVAPIEKPATVTRTASGASSFGTNYWDYEPKDISSVLVNIWDRAEWSIKNLDARDGKHDAVWCADAETLIKDFLWKVPLIYLMIDDKKVMNAIEKLGIRKIPSLKIEQKTRATFRG